MNAKENSSVFDISDAEGVNESERILMRLCRKSFLSLWAHANLHTDQDMRDGKGSAKEFSDVLLIFGSDVVIFSDKHITFQEDNNLETAWKRWYKRAITASAKQLYGAMNWLERFPNRIFLDSKCSKQIPVKIPKEGIRFHLVAITRGSADACKKKFPNSTGSHLIDTSCEFETYPDQPFTTGPLDRKKEFIHIFDEYSLEVLMDELSTVTDFINYLTTRKNFLLDTNTKFFAAGEEQLVAAYLSNNYDHKNSFIPQSYPRPDFVSFDESLYPAFQETPEYIGMREADKKSRFWDELIERFIRIGDPTLLDKSYIQENDLTEKALRLMASESRFMRRVLTENLFQLLQNSIPEPTLRRARTLTTKQSPEIVYIFLILPKYDDENDQEYRLRRAALLNAYARCAKLKFSDANTFISLGFDHPVKAQPGSSEDLVVFLCEKYDEDTRRDVESLREKLGIYKETLTVNESTAFQFPHNNALSPLSNATDKTKGSRQKKTKRKSQSNSRKANRKK